MTRVHALIVCVAPVGFTAPWAAAQGAQPSAWLADQPCQLARLLPEGTGTDIVFALSVGATAKVVAIGAQGLDFSSPLSGAVFLYHLHGGSVDGVSVLAPDNGQMGFGWSVAAESDHIYASCFSERRVYVIEPSAEGYEITDSFGPAWDDPQDFFGNAVAVDSASMVVVGARIDSQGAHDAGAAYVFEERNGVWQQTAKLLASDAQIGDKLGSSVAIDDDVIVAGAPSADPFDFASGAAYIFERDESGAWIETAKLVASDGSSLDTFGTSVAVDGGLIAVGAPTADGDEPAQGKVYLFEKNHAGQWVETAIITADDPANSDQFGFVEILGDTMLIGAKGVNGSGPGAAGAAYIFRRQPDGSWLQTAKIQPNDLGDYDEFGRAVALTEEIAVIGAPLADAHGTDSGAAYVYAIGGDTDGDGRPDLCQCRGDIDGSGVVDQPDLGLLLASFNLPIDHPLYNADADLDGDDDVDLADLGALLADYDVACQ